MLCVFIDAWNPEYLKEMPFLNSIKNNCLHGYLEVPLGYTGNIASFMTGVWPEKHGIFDLFIPDSKRKKKIENKYLNALIRILQNKMLFYTPLKIKNEYFKVSLNKTWAQRGCLNEKTLFDILEKNKKTFEVIDWPNHFKNHHDRIFFSQSWEKSLKLTEKAKADFVFVHFLDLEIAHKSGVNSEEVKKMTRKIDYACKKLYDLDENVLFFSDHGMNNIEKEFDIIREIKKLNLKFGKDFIYIVGSTSVEFWFYNKDVKEKIIQMLKRLKYGKIVDQKKFHLNTDSLIFLADFKTGFFPNFFSNKKFIGMHGWSPLEQKTYYILKNKKEKGRKDAKMVDFFPTILNIMDINPVRSDGKSLL